MKTSPVTPSFYCFNIMLSLGANIRKKLKNLYGRKFALCANCRFSKFTRNRAFPFSDAKTYGLKKLGVTGLIFPLLVT